MAFQTAQMPRPQSINRPPMPVVPLERVRPPLKVVAPRPKPKPAPKAEEPPAKPAPTVDEVLAKFKEVHLRGHYDAFTKNRQARELVEAVAAKHCLTAEEIYGEGRAARIVVAHHEAIRLVREANRGWSLSGLGRFFNRDHTTILAALRKMGLR